ncbi:hypothetical protein BU23DRAFT_600103 [Bimuria novae-zelandiae CBS 107.79]|uniref:Uncharacterized protein n=1 Tax=Bimuria novae-zelandiae CBS 107.79 TaxID=1447943 RepID=A0A6A5V5G6_9PLEO|nr:hypothetical protein BU23DRAFT_600103 [Bimuria novae-zelandiae CBS 107.79]
MNIELDPLQLEAFDHMNRAQKRAFILRDQLKYTEPHYLDIFIQGISNPEPPQYRRTSSGVQPPYEEVTVKGSAKSFDLGNVEFQDKSVRRIYLTCQDDEYEVHDADVIPENDDVLNSVPINYYVAQNTMPQFKAKYEAIHARVQELNDKRQLMYEQARSKPPKTPTRFKEGKTFVQLMNSGKDAGEAAADEQSRKRPGELVARHPLNRKKRITLDHVSNNIKTEAVNRLPDQTKVDLFNSFVKSAFPDFDDLLMASWNVVSIYVSTGSEDLMLHHSIGDLHEVLMKFEQYFGKSKKTRPSASGTTEPRSDGRNGSFRKSQGFGTPNGGDQTRLVELPQEAHLNIDDGASESSHAAESQQPSSRYDGDRRPHKQTPVRRPETPESSLSTRTTGRPLPQNHADLFSTKHAKNSRRGPNMGGSLIDEGYALTQKQKPRTPPTAQPPETPQVSPKSMDTPTRAEATQQAAKAAESRQEKSSQKPPEQRYGMFGGNGRANSVDRLFVGDDDEEALETPHMQEIHEQEEKDTPRKPLALGNSLLGTPKKGPAPVAPPMVGPSSAGKKNEERRGH